MSKPNLSDPVQRNAYWNEIAHKLLVGRKIVSVNYMTKVDIDTMGWSSRALVINLDDGTQIYPSADDEGNDAGALFTSSEKVPILPVLS